VLVFNNFGKKIVIKINKVVSSQYRGIILEILSIINFLGLVLLFISFAITNPLITKKISNPNVPNFKLI
jgi:hypothetical protein